MAKMSMIDLAYLYILKFYDQEPSIEEKKSIISEVSSLLQNGWTDYDIKTAIKNAQYKMPLPDLVKGQKKTETNLLSPFVFYYHNRLRIFPEDDGIGLDDKGRIIQKKPTDFYLEMRASFTMTELIDYFCKRLKILPQDFNGPKFAGAFRWLLDKYGIDLVLYMIDAYATAAETENVQKAKSPIDIQNYIEEARQALTAKMGVSALSEKRAIIPRKRKLDFSRKVI